MKITKTSGYSKPRYAVAVAAAMAMISVTGCTDTVRLSGEATLAEPPVIDYAGGLEMYTEPDDEIQLAGDVAMVDDFTSHKTQEYCEPIDDDLTLSGSVEIYEP